ncbi:YgiT-type zinc finger protein [Candidatus Saganbacteria bacterium]|nr:YgiT-type zinc finger protein [Candidatus Saganbacteria bacterium]
MPKKEKNENDIENEMEEVFSEASESCQACGGVLKAEKVNLEEFENGKLYLMENVSAYICEGCGEMWVPEPTLIEFEKMMDTAKEYQDGKAPLKKATHRVKRRK